MLRIAIAAAVGYVLGARAGRARYEQLARGYRAVRDNRAVRSVAHRTGTTVRRRAPRHGINGSGDATPGF